MCLCFYSCILLGILLWYMLSFFHYCPYCQLSGGKSSCPSLSGSESGLYGEFKIISVYKMVGVIFKSGYLVPECHKRRI